MAQIVLSPEISADFERILNHLLEHDAMRAEDRVDAIIAALEVLESSPLIGRPVESGMRELVIGKRSAGFVALYRYVSELDTVFVLAVRAQREAGYR